MFFYKDKPAATKESFGRVRQYYVIARAAYQLQQSRVINASKDRYYKIHFKIPEDF